MFENINNAIKYYDKNFEHRNAVPERFDKREYIDNNIILFLKTKGYFSNAENYALGNVSQCYDNKGVSIQLQFKSQIDIKGSLILDYSSWEKEFCARKRKGFTCMCLEMWKAMIKIKAIEYLFFYSDDLPNFNGRNIVDETSKLLFASELKDSIEMRRQKVPPYILKFCLNNNKKNTIQRNLKKQEKIRVNFLKMKGISTKEYLKKLETDLLFFRVSKGYYY